ncbi:MAG TPA: ATP-binding protein [Candidatus Nanopelagicales bacterium]|nr:ATP-binding protein [Candidatus Nanopelagicales bacterium]
MKKRRVLGLSLREHIGGRWAISWQLFLINVPFNMLAITTSIRAEPEGAQWWGWAVVAVAGLLAIAVGFAVADYIVLRNRRKRPVPIWVVAIVGATIGVFRGAVVVFSSAGLQLQPFAVSDLVNRMVAGGLLGALALPTGAFVLSVLTTYRSERRRLIDEKVTMERARLEERGQVEALRTALVAGVREEVTSALKELDTSDPREVSEAIRQTSHRIWQGESRENSEESAGNARVRNVLWTALKGNPIPVVPVLVLWGVSALGTTIAAIGIWWGIVNLVFSLSALWASLMLANRWIRARPGQWTLAVVSMLLVAYVFVSPISYVLFDPRPPDVALPVLVLNALWLPIVVTLVTVSSGAITSSEIVLQRLSSDVNQVQISRQALEDERDAALRELAAQLHGTAHSPLVAGSALLAGVDGETSRRRLVEQVGEAVAQIGLREGSTSLRECLAQIAAPWSGLVDVRIEVGPHLDTEPVSDTTQRTIERIVEEAIANAYRHGSADVVQVRIARLSNGIEIEVNDNGSGLGDEAQAGLGYRLFAAAAAEPWWIDNQDSGGVLLRLTIPA